MRLPSAISNKLRCWSFYVFACYRGTGGRPSFIAEDWSEVRLSLPLSWRTRNYVGTIFGGSLYGAVDPHYMIMLIHILGPDFVVWDKAATIRFKKPGRGTLSARFFIDDEEIATIRSLTENGQPIDRVYRVDLTDVKGVVHASVEKTVYIRRNVR